MPENEQITIGDLVEALGRIEDWLGDVRSLLGQLEAGTVVPTGAVSMGPPLLAQGVCPPPRKPRKPKGP